MDLDIQKLQSIVLEKQQVLNHIYSEYGQKTVYDYVQQWQKDTSSIKSIAVSVLAEVIGELYGKHVASEITTQLATSTIVSTIDHHGLLNHPFFINSNLIASLRQDQAYIICLPTAGVSLNNSSWPGCLLYHDNNVLKRASFFPDQNKKSTVLASPAYNKAQYEKIAFKILKEKPELGAFVALTGTEHVLNQKYFWQQASMVSPLLWQAAFPCAPKIVYPPLEIVMGRLLIRLLESGGSVFTVILNNYDSYKLIEKYFFGMRGAFDQAKGSFLFWGMNEQGERVRLTLHEGYLVGAGTRILLGTDSIIQALQSGQVYPTSLLCFMLLLWSGFTALGGFNQVSWLTEIKEKFVLFLKELEEEKVAEEVSLLVTNNFAESSLGFLKKDVLFRASGADVFLEKDSSLYERYTELSKRMTIAQSIELSLPDMYSVVVPESERIKALSRITEHMIAEQNGTSELMSEILTVT